MSTLGFLLSLNKKKYNKNPKNFLKTAEMGFPIIFLKHVVPSLNRTTTTTTITNNNNSNNNIFILCVLSALL